MSAPFRGNKLAERSQFATRQTQRLAGEWIQEKTKPYHVYTWLSKKRKPGVAAVPGLVTSAN